MKTNSYQDHMWLAHGIRVDEPECQVCKTDKAETERLAYRAKARQAARQARDSSLGPAGQGQLVPTSKTMAVIYRRYPGDPNTSENNMNPHPTHMTPGVIEALNEELSYQDSMAGTPRADTTDHGVAGQVVTLSRYARKLEDAWTDGAGNGAALDVMRKCAGIAVRALIKYGCPRRTQPEP